MAFINFYKNKLVIRYFMFLKKRFALVLLIPFLLFAGDTKFTKREINYVREGPASYYELVEIIPKGTKLVILNQVDQWLKVKLENNKTGWISSNSLSDKNVKIDYSKKLSNPSPDGNSSMRGIAAAIKGLRQEVRIATPGSIDALLVIQPPAIDRIEREKFRSDIQREHSSNASPLNIEKFGLEIPEYDPSMRELQIGISVGSRLLSRGTVENKELSKYFYQIVRELLANSNYYDLNFLVFLLDDEKIDGFACPGGYTFLTKGAFELCADESELAFVLGHEIAHILLKHGLKELSQQKVQIKAEDAFLELEKDLDEEKDSVEMELEELILNSYEKIVHERLLKYEVEADKVSTLLLASAGYDPFAGVRIDEKLARLYTEERDIFAYKYAAPNDAELRYTTLRAFVQNKFDNKNSNAKLQGRFGKFKELVK